jgi:hypothetical protein
MRLLSAVTALFALTILAAPASAGWWWWEPRGNDTGGIITWSPEIELVYPEMAADYCARWNKQAIITSVNRNYGDYIGFRCEFPRGYDPRNGMIPPLFVPYGRPVH